MSQARTYPASGGAPSAALIDNGILFVATNKLYAFNAAGATGCSASPVTCTPLWTAPGRQLRRMTIANGKVSVTDAEGVQAYDAAGKKDRTVTGRRCRLLLLDERRNLRLRRGRVERLPGDSTIYAYTPA